ncbi:MAG TPA: hypothetical protein VFK05_28540 [Polyangiaceae bacterium]|nr:hypothetical protein [Polyangiaceae bacterium]
MSPTCDRSAELERNVAAYLGRDPFEPHAPLVIRIGLRRGPDDRAIIADISKLDEDGKVVGVRTVSGGATCETLDDPLTLVVALMLDAPPEEPAKAPAPEPVLAPEPSEPEPIASDPSPEDKNLPPGFALISAGVGSSIGLLPFPNVGPRLQLELKPRHFWGISLGALALLGSHTDLPGSGALDFRLLQAGAALCPLSTLRDRNWFALCGGVDVAWLQAEGSDLTPHRRKTDWTLSPALQLQAARQLVGPLLVGAMLGVSFPISRNRYVYRDVAGESHLAFEVASPALVLGVFAALRVH